MILSFMSDHSSLFIKHNPTTIINIPKNSRLIKEGISIALMPINNNTYPKIYLNLKRFFISINFPYNYKLVFTISI